MFHMDESKYLASVQEETFFAKMNQVKEEDEDREEEEEEEEDQNEEIEDSSTNSTSWAPEHSLRELHPRIELQSDRLWRHKHLEEWKLASDH